MPAKSADTAPKEIPTGVFIGAIAVVVIVVIVIAWRVFSPPSEPMAGMTLQQKIEAARKAMQNYHPPQTRFKSGAQPKNP